MTTTLAARTVAAKPSPEGELLSGMAAKSYGMPAASVLASPLPAPRGEVLATPKRVKYYSTTHKDWIGAKVLAVDSQTGAIQIDKKPGAWLSKEVQETRIRGLDPELVKPQRSPPAVQHVLPSNEEYASAAPSAAPSARVLVGPSPPQAHELHEGATATTVRARVLPAEAATTAAARGVFAETSSGTSPVLAGGTTSQATLGGERITTVLGQDHAVAGGDRTIRYATARAASPLIRRAVVSKDYTGDSMADSTDASDLRPRYIFPPSAAGNAVASTAGASAYADGVPVVRKATATVLRPGSDFATVTSAGGVREASSTWAQDTGLSMGAQDPTNAVSRAGTATSSRAGATAGASGQLLGQVRTAVAAPATAGAAPLGTAAAGAPQALGGHLSRQGSPLRSRLERAPSPSAQASLGSRVPRSRLSPPRRIYPADEATRQGLSAEADALSASAVAFRASAKAFDHACEKAAQGGSPQVLLPSASANAPVGFPTADASLAERFAQLGAAAGAVDDPAAPESAPPPPPPGSTVEAAAAPATAGADAPKWQGPDSGPVTIASRPAAELPSDPPPADPAADEAGAPAQPAQPAQPAAPSSPIGSTAQVASSMIKYRCPKCGELCDTIEEALHHCRPEGEHVTVREGWREGEGSSSPTAAGAAAASAEGGAAAAPSAPAQQGFVAGLAGGEPIAYDERGRATIVRQVDPDSGSARTIVLNDDGSHRVFGENTVASLTSSSHSDATRWASGLTNHQLRGLVHEVGQRLLNESQLYHARLAQLERLGENENYRFFGLDADATEKDLDNAYRKLARQWHPDKNGGTDEAKKRFQNMKERYEALKKKRGESSEKDDKGKGEKSKKGRNRDKSEEDDESPKNSNDEDEEEQRSAKSEGQEDEEEEEQTPDDDGPRLCILDGDKPSPQKEREREKTAVDSDDEDAGEEDGSLKEEDEEQQKSTSIEYDPSDKDSMVRTVSRMVKQLKNIEVQMKVLVKELGRAQRSAP